MTNFSPTGSGMIVSAIVEGERSRSEALSRLVKELEKQVEDRQASAGVHVAHTPHTQVLPFYTGISHSVEKNAEGTYDGTITATVTMKQYSLFED